MGESRIIPTLHESGVHGWIWGQVLGLSESIRCCYPSLTYVKSTGARAKARGPGSLKSPSSQAKKIKNNNKVSSGWTRPVYINRHPQPPAKYIGFYEISQEVYLFNYIDRFRDLGYSGIMFNLIKGIII